MVLKSYQIIKDISLMYMNSNQCLKLPPLHLGEIACGLLNQEVKELQESLVGLLHHLAVVFGID